VAAIAPTVALLAAPASPGAAAGVVTHASMLHAGVDSSNWSGYASSKNPAHTFTSVSASWVEPTGTCTSSTRTAAAFWVGLDGYRANSPSVEQTGSDVDCVGGNPQYYAWYEMYPAGSVDYRNLVKPGDDFTASVTASGKSFTITIADTTQNWTETQHETSGSAKQNSAEVIAEAPSDESGILPLTDFGTVNFTSAMANGVTIGTNKPVKITMATSGGTIEAKPSALSSDENFSVAWESS
jgi:hypothetical protein